MFIPSAGDSSKPHVGGSLFSCPFISVSSLRYFQARISFELWLLCSVGLVFHYSKLKSNVGGEHKFLRIVSVNEIHSCSLSRIIVISFPSTSIFLLFAIFYFVKGEFKKRNLLLAVWAFCSMFPNFASSI